MNHDDGVGRALLESARIAHGEAAKALGLGALDLRRIEMDCAEGMPPGADATSGAWGKIAAAIERGAQGWARHQSGAYWFADGGANRGFDEKELGAPLFAQWFDADGCACELAPDAGAPGALRLRRVREFEPDGELRAGAGAFVLGESIDVYFKAPGGAPLESCPAKLRYRVYWGAPPGAQPSAITRLHHWFNGYIWQRSQS